MINVLLVGLSQLRLCSFPKDRGGKFSNYIKYEYVDMASLFYYGGCKVYSIDRRCESDIKIPFITELDENEDLSKYNFDIIYIVNSLTRNIFGGFENIGPLYHKIVNYINKYNGKLYYSFRDADSILYNDIKNTIQIENKFSYMSQAKDTEKLFQYIKNSGTKSKPIVPKNILFYPFEKIAIFNNNNFREITYPNYNDNPEYDLVYVGSYKKHRIKNLKRFIPENNNLKTLIASNKPDDYKTLYTSENFTIQGSVLYKDLRTFMNKAVATITTGDIFNNEYNSLLQRIYEAVDAKVVSFIDIQLDKEKRAFSNQELKDFLYVNNYQELSTKIEKLKTNDLFRKHIIDLQLNDPEYKIDYKEYCKKFVEELLANV